MPNPATPTLQLGRTVVELALNTPFCQTAFVRTFIFCLKLNFLIFQVVCQISKEFD